MITIVLLHMLQTILNYLQLGNTETETKHRHSTYKMKWNWNVNCWSGYWKKIARPKLALFVDKLLLFWLSLVAIAAAAAVAATPVADSDAANETRVFGWGNCGDAIDGFVFGAMKLIAVVDLWDWCRCDVDGVVTIDAVVWLGVIVIRLLTECRWYEWWWLPGCMPLLLKFGYDELLL